jgi:signal transduction histidine kinase
VENESARHAPELERRVEERTRQLTTLLQISRDVTSNLSLESVLQEILEKLRSVVPYTNATIVRREGEMLHRLADWRGLQNYPDMLMQFSADNPIDRQVMASKQPFIVADVHLDQTPEALDFRAEAGVHLQDYYKSTRSWMRVPLIFRSRVIGMLTLHYDQPNFYSQNEAGIAMAFAEHAAIAIENARLFEIVERRTSELASLLNVAQTVASTLEIKTLLTLILDQLNLVVEYELASVNILENKNELVLLAARGPGLPPVGTRFLIDEHFPTYEILEDRKPLFVPDVNADTPLAITVRADLASQNLDDLNSWVGVPLIARDSSIGMLSLAHRQANYFTGARVDLLMTFAHQAAIAIENARLYEQVRELAALEERQKLARELHDSVSQALYGIVLGARTARTLLERDPGSLDEPLEYIASLAEAGLAEMRALIFELRPESLRVEGLVAALKKKIEALQARHQLVVEASLCPEPDVSLAVKEALYRVAQEALHNITKHAGASRVEVYLEKRPRYLALSIRDDGVGFDPIKEYPGHLGLRSMRERVEMIEGEFTIESAPGKGTSVQAKICLAE